MNINEMYNKMGQLLEATQQKPKTIVSTEICRAKIFSTVTAARLSSEKYVWTPLTVEIRQADANDPHKAYVMVWDRQEFIGFLTR